MGEGGIKNVGVYISHVEVTVTEVDCNLEAGQPRLQFTCTQDCCSVCACRCALLCRLAMAELERALSALNALEHVGGSSTLAVRSAAAAAGTGQPAAAAEGMVLYKLYKVYREAQGLYRLKDSTSRYSDWPHLSADLLAMVEPSLAPAAKLDLHNRMLRTYCVLQP